MLQTLDEATIVALIGLIGGVLLGLAARLGRFCTLGAIEDYLYGGDDTRLRMWALAIGVAILGSFGLLAFGLLDMTDSFYLTTNWSPMASVVGGLIFGYGMAIAGNCGYGALARLGGGDLRSFVIVLVMGIAAFAAISGPFAELRLFLFPATGQSASPEGYAHFLAEVTGSSPVVPGLLIGLLVTIGALSNKTFRGDLKSVGWASVVGLSVVFAWAGTAYVYRNGFNGLPVVSHSFAAPVGQTVLYAMTSTVRTLNFAIGSVAGVWIGAFIGSMIKGHFRWEACEDPRELRRQFLGAVLMGIGAVIAVGCSIGQGLSAFSLLSYSAPVTLASIFAGAAIGLRQLIVGFVPSDY